MNQDNQLIELANQKVEEMQKEVASDSFRLHFHLMPPVGFLNDPNGLVHFKGKYHVFYQWNPFETGHGAKFWGHLSSENLLDWQVEPIALAPGHDYDRNGCYSGSAIEHEGKLYLYYTGNVKDANGKRKSFQCVAVSSDGRHFQKKGPLIHLPKGYTAHFRDPKVWKDRDGFWMVLGAQTEQLEGVAVLYHSHDAMEWERLGDIAGSGMNGLNDFGYMWECPDLFEIDDDMVLLVSPQGLEPQGNLYQNMYQSGYFVGGMDKESWKFKHGEFTELDRGFDFYAPQTLHDDKGRRILIAWMGISDEQEAEQPTIAHGWLHALTIPRELKMCGNKLLQIPAQELTCLRENPTHFSLSLSEGERTVLRDDGTSSCELEFKFPQQASGMFEIDIRNDIKFIYDPKNALFSLERDTFNKKGREIRSCHLERLHTMRVFLDTSSIEVFLNDGAEVFTARYFPAEQEKEIVCISEAQLQIECSTWDLRPMGWIEKADH